MVSPTLVAVPLTIVPAMGLLWLMLHRYEGYFEDARVFFALVAGFFAGILVAFLESQFGFTEYPGLAGFVLVAFGYAFFEAGAKTVVLGFSRFRKRKDTPYYGAAFGLGFGAMLALAFISLALRTADLPEVPDYTVVPFLLLVMMFTGALLAHGGSTVLVGRGSAEGKLAKGWLQATAVQAPILACLWFYWPSMGDGSKAPLVAVASMLYGAGVLVYASTRILDRIVPQEIRDMVQKEKRRAEREKMREGPGAP